MKTNGFEIKSCVPHSTCSSLLEIHPEIDIATTELYKVVAKQLNKNKTDFI